MIKLIDILNEIKVNEPEIVYFLNPIFKPWLNTDWDDLRYEFGDDTADAVYMFNWVSPDSKTLRLSNVKKFLEQEPAAVEVPPESYIEFLRVYDIISDRPIDEMKVNDPSSEIDLKDIPLTRLKPGEYKIKYTIENRSSWDEITEEITQDMIDEAIRKGDSEYWFWRDVIHDMNSWFTKGDNILAVYKNE